jgi:hypothetical protein
LRSASARRAVAAAISGQSGRPFRAHGEISVAAAILPAKSYRRSNHTEFRETSPLSTQVSVFKILAKFELVEFE